jgi:hypothetical protein
MLAKFLLSVSVFAGPGLAQGPSPTHGLYQFREGYQTIRMRDVSRQALGSYEPSRFTTPRPASSVVSARRLAHTPPRQAVRANVRGVGLAPDPSMSKARHVPGPALKEQLGRTKEAVRQLRVVESDYPEAHRIVASAGHPIAP